MKMFSSWFGKGRKSEEGSASTQAAAPDSAPGSADAVTEAAEQPDQTASEALAEDGASEAQDESASAGEPAEAEKETEADADTEPAETDADSGAETAAAEASGPEPKKGRLGRMWEATRRLALTPVDPWFAKMAEGLNKTRHSLVGQVKNLFSSRSNINDELWDDLEDVLLTADVGVEATEHILDELRGVVKAKKLQDPKLLTDELKAIMSRVLGAEETAEESGGEAAAPVQRGLRVEKGRLTVVLMVGVNGAGKTTTTAKLAARYKAEGFKVLMAAADTFRAAAIDQLQVWADRVGVDLIRHNEGADPAAVVFDAVQAAKARGVELLLVDTAGRLHNKANLMEELRKIRRVAGRDLEGAPHETILVLDATTGQNALEQARVFNKVTELTGLVLCKLDGTSRGGIILAITQELNIPVRYIGVGEGVDDLREFEPQQFLDALFND